MKILKYAIVIMIAVTMAALSLVFAGSHGKICGKVLDADNNQPVIGARVQIDGTTMSVIVDPQNGSYTLDNVPPGTYNLTASCIGFNSTTINDVIVKADSTTEIDFVLNTPRIELDSILLVAKPAEIDKYETSSVNRISSREIEALPVTDIQRGSLHKRGSRAGELGFIDDGVLIRDNLAYLGQNSKTSERLNERAEQYRWNTESYAHIVENVFLKPQDNPLSTFSIDVDAASYSNIRRHLNNGSLPPVDAVRLEEMINYFTYDYPQPDNDEPFSITTELSECPWNKDHNLLHIGLQGQDIDMEDLPPSNLVFLIDVSGSMRPENKLPLLQQSMKLLVNELREQDRVAIVTYAGNAGLVLESTSGSEKEKIIRAIDGLSAGGCTAGAKGIITAYKVAKKYFTKGGNNRVILATDGDFNIGVSSDGEMTELIESKRDDGIFLTVLGFGMGNYKDSKMEILADKGNGNYAYIDNINEAKKVLVKGLRGTLFTIAKDVKIQIEFNPLRVKGYRLLGYENRILAKEDFNDDTKDAGELGAGHTVTALYEIIPADSEEKLASVDDLKYQVVMIPVNAIESQELANIKLRYKQPDGKVSKLIEQAQLDEPVKLSRASDNLRFSAAVAEWGMMLRDSQFRGDGSYEQVLKLANNAMGDDDSGYRGEFIKLVEKSIEIEGELAGN